MRCASFLLLSTCLWACDAGDGVGAQSAERHLLIVTTEPLLEVAQEYADYRAGQGYIVSVVTTQQALDEGGGASLVEAVQAWTRGWAAEVLAAADPDADTPLYLLIIGDALSTSPGDPMYVPVVDGAGGFVGDAAYGDLDDDGAPDVAVGRIPVTEPAEVRAYLDRVRQYELDRVPGPWNKTLHACAGEGGFGPDIDYVIEYAALRIFESLSYDIDITMAYAASSSPYYLPPTAWDEDYVRRYNAGSVLQPYIGHTLGWADTAALEVPVRRGMVAYLSCSDGEFQHGSNPGALADEMLLLPAGPMLALAASDWSHPYGNAILALELSEALFNERAPTYGMALVWAKHGMLYPEGALRAELDMAAGAFLDEPADHLARTHAVMYNLLGDPTLSPGMPPGQVTFGGVETLTLGATVQVSGRVSTDDRGSSMAYGELTLTLECERGEILGDLIPVDGEPTVAQAVANHATANDKVILRVTAAVQDGAFSATLNLPGVGLATGRYYLKGYALNATTDAMGSAEIRLIR